MIWLILAAIVDIALIVIAYALAKKQNESQWLLFVGLCLIPIVGPGIVIYAYVLNTTIANEYKLAPGGPKESSKKS